MTNQKLIIYDFTQLYLILDELKDQINFEIINIEKDKLEKLLRDIQTEVIDKLSITGEKFKFQNTTKK